MPELEQYVLFGSLSSDDSRFTRRKVTLCPRVQKSRSNVLQKRTEWPVCSLKFVFYTACMCKGTSKICRWMV